MVTCAIVGYGPRGEYVFGKYLSMQPDTKIVAVAELYEAPRNRAKEAFGLADDMVFNSAEDFFAKPKMCDVVVISTDDSTHAKYAMMAAEKGYHILTEKPISKYLKECQELSNAVAQAGVVSSVCHELRYGADYATIKKLIQSGVIGTPMHLSQTEHVQFWHYAHSYDRGVWRKEETSSPMILAKCCHDTDMILWLMEGAEPTYVSSFGSLSYFNKKNAPEGCAERCLDGCKYKNECIYDVEKYYLRKGLAEDTPDYLRNMANLCFAITKEEPTEENLYKALQTGQYGKCVFRNDNDVVDHQTVIIEFNNGATADLKMLAFTGMGGRRTRVFGTKGEIIYDEDVSSKITLRVFGKEDELIEPLKFGTELMYGHDEADYMLIKAFVEKIKQIQNGEKVDMDSSIERSIKGHIVALLAEESRLKHGQVYSVNDYI